MDQNSTLSESRRAAVGYLSQIFSEIVCAEGRDLLESEDLCMREGHLLLAEALSSALERYDDLLCSKLPDGLRIHDRRRRTLATKLGDVRFSWRRCRDAAGNTVIPLADALDIPWGARISPSARAFLVEAGAEVSFAKSARLLGSAGGSSVSAASVMGALHKTGELCAREDEKAARSLYRDGFKYSERELPHPTRLQSASPRRRARSNRRERAYLKTRIDTTVPVKVGRGSEAEHKASLANCSAEVRYAAAVDSGMVGIG